MLGGIRKAVLWLFLAMALVGGVYGAECGGNPTNGCLITGNTTFNAGTYYLPSGIIMWEPSVYLDCNGATLIGSGYGGGVSVDADYVTIKNCNIQNYDYGIRLNAWEDIVCGWGYYVSKNALVEGNILTDNDYGIYIKGTGCDPGNYHVIANNNINNDLISGIYLDFASENNISGNSFVGNANYAIHTDCPSTYNNIWDNDIYDTGIKYDCTSSNNYCVNDVGNRYYNGVKGPTCSCLPLQDGLIINNNVTACKDVYNLTYGPSIVTSDTYLDCNGATLIGSGDSGAIGVNTLGTDYVTIKNCNIENYDYGIRLNAWEDIVCGWGYYVSKNNLVKENTLTNNRYAIYIKGTGCDPGNYHVIANNNINNNLISGIYLDYASGNNISGNYFYSNYMGVYLDPLSQNNLIWNNDILSDNYSIYNNQADNVSAENNWWGSADEDYIKPKIYDCLDDFSKGCVDYSPWLTIGPEDRILDLGVGSSGISFEDLGDEIKTSALISNKGSYDANNVEVEFLDIYNGMLIKKSTINIGIVGALNSKKASVNWELEQNHIVYVIIDPDNKIRESDKGNNNAHREYTGTLKYYVEVDVPPSAASYEIETYIKDNIKDGVIVNNEEEADAKVLVARHNPLIVWHFETLEDEGWGFYGGTIKFQDEVCDKPYCGVVGDMVKDGKKEIYIEANEVDGFIAASKAFIEKQDSFTGPGNVIFLDEKNEDAIAVYDYLHTPVNLPYYKEDSDEFREIVRRALKGEMYEEEQINTTANDVTLRLLHLKPGFSTMFIDYKDEVKLPVVLARGLWSDLYTWKDFGEELSSNEGRDTWLIEITGGPGQECDSCPNYSFDDLTDSYVPALLDKVLSETGKSELQYVGFSNGCRATLSSLEKGSFEPSKVDTFVGVGCPGAFEKYFFQNGISPFAEAVKETGEELKENLKSYTHLTAEEVGKEMLSLCTSYECLEAAKSFNGNNKISYNLSERYFGWILDGTDTQPGIITLDNFKLIYGTMPFIINLIGSGSSDGVVSVKDSEAIYDNINTINSKEIKRIRSVKHTSDNMEESLPDSKVTKDEIKKYLAKEVN